VIGALAGLWNSTNNLLFFRDFLYETGLSSFAMVYVVFGLFSLLALIGSIAVPFFTRTASMLLIISVMGVFLFGLIQVFGATSYLGLAPAAPLYFWALISTPVLFVATALAFLGRESRSRREIV
jgi:hypothetical protein